MNDIYSQLAEVGIDLGASSLDRAAQLVDGDYMVRVAIEPVPTTDKDGKPYKKIVAGKDYAGASFYPKGTEVTAERDTIGAIKFNVPVKVEVLNDEGKVVKTFREYLWTGVTKKGTSLALDFVKAFNAAAKQEVFDLGALLTQKEGELRMLPLAEQIVEVINANPTFTLPGRVSTTVIKRTKKADGTPGPDEVLAGSAKTAQATFPAEWAGKEDLPEGVSFSTRLKGFPLPEVQA